MGLPLPSLAYIRKTRLWAAAGGCRLYVMASPSSLYRLLVQITRRSDGGAVLKCVRVDGSETWQKQEGKQAAFFPIHDLTHFSVERELDLPRAFYGLIAEGWSITDTEGKGPRGPLPPDAIFAEHLVGTLDAERAGGQRWAADDVNDSIARSYAKAGITLSHHVSDDDLRRIRKRRAELLHDWAAVAPGRTLELQLPPRAAEHMVHHDAPGHRRGG